MPAEISAELKGMIWALRLECVPYRKIVQKLSDQGISVCLKTVARFIKTKEEEENGRPRAPKKLGPQNLPSVRTEALVLEVKKAINSPNPPSQNQLAKTHKVSRHTIQRVLAKDLGAKSAADEISLVACRDFAMTMLPLTSHNEEFSGSRTPRRCREQNICDAIHCDDCGEFFEEACWDHVSRIENTPVVPLALASLPECLMIDICENSHEKGIFTRNSIPHQTLFGPMVGALCSSNAYSPFGCTTKDGSGIKRFHLDSDSCCNWMRYVRFAKNKQEQNLMACLHDHDVYFVVTREIRTGEELKVGYSRRYQEILKECAEPVRYCAGPFEFVGLPADCEPETVPVEIVEFVEVLPDPVEHQIDEVNPLVRRRKRKCTQSELYGAEEDEADDSASHHEDIHPNFVDPGPLLPTDQDHDPHPTENFGFEAMSVVDLLPDHSNVSSSVSAREKKNLGKRRSRVLKKNPALVIKFPCTECSVHFPSEESLVIHRLWHDGKETNVKECPECGMSFDEFGWLAMHVNKLHASRYEPREKCQYCTLFISTRWMEQHMQNTHPLESAIGAIIRPSGSGEAATNITAVNVFKCDECNLFFPSERLLVLHSRQHSGLLVGVEEECPECNIVIEGAEEWIQHINQHGKQIVMTEKCKYCPCSTVERGKMDSHVRRAHPSLCDDRRETFPCDTCGEAMPSLHSLRMHNTARHKTPQCVICAKIEESWRTLSQHVLAHREEDGFHCPHCTSIFATYPRLSAHCSEIHLMKNVRTCEICNKSFRNPIWLKRHLRIHSDEREFSCERCGKGFHTRQNLRNHVKSMHKDGLAS